jgi:glucuronosyltransferase
LEVIHSQQGKVALVAFGSHAQLSPEMIRTLWGALVLTLDNQLLDKVIWSVSKSKHVFPSDLSHPKITRMSWVPQYDLLQHPALALFVSHAGGESSHEALLTATPMLAIPIFGDQPGNAFRMQQFGVGKAHHKLHLRQDELYASIQHLLQDPNGHVASNLAKYQDLATRASQKGMLEALDILETAALYGDGFLFPDVRNASWFYMGNYDIILAVVSILVFSACLLWRMGRFFFRKCSECVCSDSRKEHTD